MANWKFWKRKVKEDTEWADEQAREEEKRRRKQQEEIRKVAMNGERDYTQEPITEEEIREFAESPESPEFDSEPQPKPEFEAEPEPIEPVEEYRPTREERALEKSEREREKAESKARIVASRYGDERFEKWLEARPRSKEEIEAYAERVQFGGQSTERARAARTQYAEEQTKRYRARREKEEVTSRAMRGREVSRIVKGVATLGGPIPHRNARSPLYNPVAPRGTYSRGTSRSLTSVGGVSTMADLVTPRLGALQTTRPAGAMPIAPAPLPVAATALTQMSQMSSVGGTYAKLRNALLPTNARLAQAPGIAYRHLQSNGGADTQDNTVQKLVAAGFTEKEAKSAIRTLTKKRLAKKTKEMGAQYGGDTVLEVMR